MARIKGIVNYSSNFEVRAQGPLDARMLVEYYSDLVNPATWQDSESLIWLFNGAMVVVSTDPSAGVYWLKDAPNYTDYASWVPVGIATPFDSSSLYAYIDGSLALRDSSISDLYSLIQIIDSSIEYLINWNTSIDASLIRIDGSLNIIFNHLDSIDASIIDLRSAGPYVKESSLGDGLVWNNITGLLDVSIDSGTFTGDISTSHVFYDPALDPSLAMPNTVGGIPAGTTVYDLQGDSLRSLLNDLLFPTQNPVLTGPSAIIAVSPTTLLYEVSANVNLTFTSTLNRGSINPQYSADSPYRSGLPNNFNFTGFGLVDMSSNSIPYISPAFDMSIGLTQSWSVAISYDGGVQPFNNKGVIYDSSLAPGTVSSNTITISGSYPYFATTSNIATLTKQTLVALSTNPAPSSSGMLLVAESGGNKQKFEIPNARLALHALTGIRNYNTNNSQWEYELGSASLSLTRWTTSSVTETIQGYTIDYTRYTYNGPDRGQMTIRLEF